MLRRTDELLREAEVQARTFGYKDLVFAGSTYWLGTGADLDVVLLVNDMGHCPPSATRCLDEHYEGVGFQAYRVGVFNFICVEDHAVFAGWAHATYVLSRKCPQDKSARIAACVTLRAAGEEAYQESACQSD